LLAVPANLAPNEKLPVAFLWHWLGGDANDFYERGDVQTAVDHYRFLAVIPESKGDVKFKWPIESFQSQGRINEELTFFDDMLSCVAEQYNVELGCVGSVGVSAGALFTSAVLAGGRGQYLSSILSLSGGVGGFIKDWKASAHKMPALVLWGGPNDNCFGLMNFVQTSHNLENALGQDGHFFLECIHNCGHAAPPFEIPGAPTAFAPLWDFILDHPYWLDGGASPYEQGIPPTMPEWCGVGAGSAEPRTGECTEKSGC
jgi:predicted esterase